MLMVPVRPKPAPMINGGLLWAFALDCTLVLLVPDGDRARRCVARVIFNTKNIWREEPLPIKEA